MHVCVVDMHMCMAVCLHLPTHVQRPKEVIMSDTLHILIITLIII